MTDVTATERAAAGPPATGPAGTAAVLTVDNLRVSFGPNEVVKGISFTTYRGRCLAIVGESGSGKSVTARTLVGLTGAGSAVQADRIDLGGVDLTRQSERAWRSIRGREISFILQDALVSLDQLRLVGDEVSEPLKLHGRGTKTSRRERAIELLGSVGVPEPEMRVRQRPYELSGGLQQRALIASAIALDPGLLIADEPTTALDVTIQAQVHDLLADSKARGRSIILISHDLSVVARLADEVNRTVVDDVSFELFKGETLGIVGESGSGKTTTARIALAVLPGTAGYVLLHGHPWSALSSAARRPLRKRIGVIYQDPLSSFDPRWAAGRVIIDALGTGSRPPSSRAEGRARAVRLLEQVGLGEEHLNAAPLRMSGGQRQRVAIARAPAPEPEVLICDEPVSALDVSVQAQVLDLLTDLQDELGGSCLFISHDSGVIHHMSDRILVMREGKVVESGSADAVFERPQDPYTQRLLTALPRLTQSGDAAWIAPLPVPTQWSRVCHRVGLCAFEG